MNDVMENVEETIHPGMADRAEETAKSLRAQYGAMTPEAFHQWGFAESNIMLGYLLLAIQEKGFSSSPMLGFVPDKVKELFGLPDDVTIPALVAMGEAAEDGFPQYRKPLDRWVKYV
jgi:nitroreductase